MSDDADRLVQHCRLRSRRRQGHQRIAVGQVRRFRRACYWNPFRHANLPVTLNIMTTAVIGSMSERSSATGNPRSEYRPGTERSAARLARVALASVVLAEQVQVAASGNGDSFELGEGASVAGGQQRSGFGRPIDLIVGNDSALVADDQVAAVGQHGDTRADRSDRDSAGPATTDLRTGTARRWSGRQGRRRSYLDGRRRRTSIAGSKWPGHNCGRLGFTDVESARTCSSAANAMPYQAPKKSPEALLTVKGSSMSPTGGESCSAAVSVSMVVPRNSAAARSVVIGATLMSAPRWSTMCPSATRIWRSSPKNGVPKPPNVQRKPNLPLTWWRTGAIT
ncbi:hypothetical protein GQR58_029194 [Nymphon striatum]|nr:hypothetical protein GQR58_029194 [Nymphon striatum]